MSADALRSRLHADIDEKIVGATAVLVERRQATLDELRYQQGLIAGYRDAQDLLTERYRNLYAIG